MSSSALPPPTVTITTHGQINIVPKPQARPRFGSIPGRGGRGAPRKVCMTDPTKAYKKTLLREWYHSIGPQQRALLPLQGRVTLQAEFVFARPKSHYRAVSASKKRKHPTTDTPPPPPQLTARAAQQWEHHTQKPDIDNLLKALMDGLAPAYVDDCQVASCTCTKRWAQSPSEPSGITVTLTGTPSNTGVSANDGHVGIDV